MLDHSSFRASYVYESLHKGETHSTSYKIVRQAHQIILKERRSLTTEFTGNLGVKL